MPSLTPHRARQLGIQVIFQDLSLFPNLTVEENIAIGLELSAPLKPPPRKQMRDAAKAALARLDANLPLDALVGRLAGRAAPDRRHLPRAGGECPHPVHGRTDRIADPA